MSLLKDFIESQSENIDREFLTTPYATELIAKRRKAISNIKEQLKDSALEEQLEECLELFADYSGYGFFWAYEKGISDIGNLIKELIS